MAKVKLPTNPLHVPCLTVGGQPGFRHSSSSSCSSLPINCEFKTIYAYVGGVWKVTNHPHEQVRYGIPYQDTSSYACPTSIERSLRLRDPSRRNLLIWEDAGNLCDAPDSHDRQVRTHLKLNNIGPNRNGGVVLNYHLVDPFTNPHFEYFTASLNLNQNRVEILRFNGVVTLVEAFAVPPLPFNLVDWFEIRAWGTELCDGCDTRINVRVRNVSNPGWGNVTLNFVTSNWKTPDGYFGIFTNRAVTDFSFWELT